MRKYAIVISLAAMAFLARAAVAGDGCGAGPENCGTLNCCAKCGCRAACQPKVCQVVCEIKKETKYCWCVECKDFCPLLPTLLRRDGCDEAAADGKSCGEGCKDGCKECGGEGCGHCPNPPHCGRSREIKTLVKREYQVDVPVYKCVTQYLCSACASCAASQAEKAAPAPTMAPPKPANPAPAPMPAAPNAY
jgi:hypothetical protein